MAQNNAILAALASTEADVLRRAGKHVVLEPGRMLAEDGAPIEQVFFPSSGVIAVVTALAGGERLESALIGRNGALGGGCALGAATHVGTAFVQMQGEALAVPTGDVAALSARNDRLRALLFSHEQYVLAQAQQTAACNARHPIPQRLATWLIRARDSAGQTQLQLTQEFLAQMIGVQRASVSIEASRLQDSGAIRYQRGRIEIVNDDKLVEVACECCLAVRTQCRRLLGDAARN